MPHPDIERMRAEVAAKISADPAVFAKDMIACINEWLMVLRALGAPRQILVQEQEKMAADLCQMFKAKVEEELLQSQKATNEALSAALGMRGQPK